MKGGGGEKSATPGVITGGDARQFSREFALRRENAEALRKELIRQGVPVADLDRVIDELRKLEMGRGYGDPVALDDLQAAMIENVKNVEFSLYRKLGLGDDKSPTLGTSAPVPAEYRAAVEEYYRSLAGGRRSLE